MKERTWAKKTLGELLDFYNGKAITAEEEGEFPVYGSNGVIGRSAIATRSDGIIIGRVGAYCGSIYYCPLSFWATDNTIVVKTKSPADDIRFFHYLLNHLDLHRHAGGSAQPLVTQSVLKQLEVAIPNLNQQRHIASILSAYDDLIGNNTRRIKILEEMAQMLYREWFVNFHFPGHEKVRMVKSELGPIPEGWSVVGFDRIADILSGGTPRTTEPAYWDGSIPFFGPTDAPDAFYVLNTARRITELGLGKCNSKLYPAETVFITARGTVGKVVLPSCGMAMNQSCYALRGKAGINQLALFLMTRHCANQLKQKAHGAVFDTITVETFQKLRVARPTDPLLDQVELVLRPVFVLIVNLLKRNNNLRTTRDLLLPKLISGEISVEAAADLMEQNA